MSIVVDGSIEWLKDESTGDVVGYKRKNGGETPLFVPTINPATGGATWTAAQFAAITPVAGQFYLVTA